MFLAHSRRLLAALAFGLVSHVASGAQTHWYQFNGDLSDSQGGPSLVANGGTTFAGGYSFAANQGLSLTGALSANVYTIDLTFSLGTKAGWSKIVDFKGLDVDSGLYRFMLPTGGALQICDCSTQINSPAGLIVDNQSVRVTLTRDAGNLVTQYVNGAAVGTYQDNSGIFTFSTPGQVAHFFRDDQFTGGGESVAGTVTRIVLFDSALTASEVATLAPVPEPESWAMLLAGIVAIGTLVSRKRPAAA
jgi:hypothetical protein